MHKDRIRMGRMFSWAAAGVVASFVLAGAARAEYTVLWDTQGSTLEEGYLENGMLGDFDGDGRLEIVGDENGRLYVRDAMTGISEASFQMSPNVVQIGLADLDFDGTPEIIGDGGDFRFVLDFATTSSTPIEGVGVTHLLLGASPNPFAPKTSIAFALGVKGKAVLDIHDVGGRRVRRLFSENMAAGVHRVEWDGNDDHGRRVASGTYFYQLRHENQVVGAERVVVLK